MELNTQILELVQNQSANKNLASELGFFSKPIRMMDSNGNGYVVKFYRPLASKKRCEEMIANHEQYIVALREIGIKIPETNIQIIEHKKRFQLIISQHAFRESEL